MKVCKDCGAEKPLSDFYLQKGRWPYSQCKPCHYARTRAGRAKYLDTIRSRERERYDPQRSRLKHWREKYGIGQEDVDALVERQGGSCAVCALPFSPVTTGRDLREAVIDHDHESGEVRGLLHRECNVALDLLARLTPTDLFRVRAYLARGSSRERQVA